METTFCDNTIHIPLTEDLILRRDELGTWTNVPHLVTHHSPSGFEWGYGGSGPADLALNIVEAILNHLGHHGHRIDCWQGTCWYKAYQLHQEFKWTFIAPADRDGDRISYSKMVAWVKERLED